MRKETPIGEFRHRVTFQQPVKVDDGHGGHTVSWVNLVTVWGAIEPISGREYFEAHQIQAEITHRVRIRYLPAVTEELRIFYNGRIFEIESIIDINERRRFMDILCREAK